MLIGRHSFIRQNKLSDVAGRIDYISNPKRQEHLYATYQTEGATPEFWKNLARENQLDFKASGTTGKCIEGREFIIALPESFVEYKADDVARQEWNRTVDVALVEGVPEEDILTIKREKITDKTLQSIRTHGWLPDMFQQIIRGAKDFLQEMIFKFKLPPKPVPKIDLQEWNDMRKLMEKLQKQSQAMKSTQQEISSLKKQLSETTGFFKGKARKSLEGKIEQSEKQEKRIHTDMEQTVKQAGYPDVQSFAKTYQKSEKLVREYNEELRAWKNQTEPKKEKLSEPSKKASIREKLHRYQQESRQQPKQTAKKKSMDRGR